MTKFRILTVFFAAALLIPVFAAADGAVNENNDLLVELACNPNQSFDTAEIALEPTDPMFMTGCSAEKTDCFNGGPTISCEGTSSCEVACGWVRCDGVATDCHSCNKGCNTPEYCACRSCGGGAGICFQTWCN